MKRLLALLLAIGLFTSVAFAHNGMEHIMGTVASITDASIVVKTSDGKSQTIVLNSETKYAKTDTVIALKDIKVGDHVVVHAKKKEGQVIAVEVKVGMDMKGMGDMKGMKMDH
jgi:Cu/Ag efflux protein CusF